MSIKSLKRLLTTLKVFLLKNLYGYFEEFTLYIRTRSKLSHSPKIKFIIFGRGRSGSTLLVNLLNSNKDIHCDGEILTHKKLYPRKTVLRKLNLTKSPVYGFKLLSYQIRSVQPIKNGEEFIKELENEGFKFIYLYRANILLHVISKLYATYFNKWHSKKTSKKNELTNKMEINLELLISAMEESETLLKYERTLLKNVPHLKICYESDLADAEKQRETLQKISSYLECQINYTSPDLQKHTPSHLSEFIQNYDEMHDFLCGTRFKKYLQ